MVAKKAKSIFQRGGKTAERLNTTTTSSTSGRQATGKQNMVLLSTTCSSPTEEEYYDGSSAFTSTYDNTTFATSFGDSTIADSILDYQIARGVSGAEDDPNSFCLTNLEIGYWVEKFLAPYGFTKQKGGDAKTRRKFRHVQRLLAEAEKERKQVEQRLNQAEEARKRELDAVMAQIEHTMTQQIKSLEDKLVATAMDAAAKQNADKQKQKQQQHQQKAARPKWQRQQQQEQESRNDDDDADDDAHHVRDLPAAKKESQGNPAMQKIKEIKQKLIKASRLPPLEEVRVGDDDIEQRQEHGDQNQVKHDHASAQLLIENSEEEAEHDPVITTVDSCGALTKVGVEETLAGLIGHVNKSSAAKMKNEAAEGHVEDAEEKREGSVTAIAEDHTKKDEGKDEQTPMQSSTECNHSFDILGSMMHDLARSFQKVQLFGTSNSTANPLTTTSSEAQQDEEQQQPVEEQQGLTGKEEKDGSSQADEEQKQVEEQQDLTGKEEKDGALLLVAEEPPTTTIAPASGEKKMDSRTTSQLPKNEISAVSKSLRVPNSTKLMEMMKRLRKLLKELRRESQLKRMTLAIAAGYRQTEEKMRKLGLDALRRPNNY